MIEQDTSDDIFEFVQEAQEYRIGARVVPRVTRILKDAGLVRFHCGAAALARACDRGSTVHMITEDIEKAPDADYWSGGEYEGYARAWQSFIDRYQFKSDVIEDAVYSTRFDYAGRIDRRGWMFYNTTHETYIIGEIKTGAPSPWHREQTAAYWLCLPDDLRERAQRVGIYLRPDGEFRRTVFDDPNDQYNFLAALTTARLRAERNLIRDDDIFDELICGGYDREFGNERL